MRFLPAFLGVALAAQVLVFSYSVEISMRIGGMPQGLLVLHLTAIVAFSLACLCLNWPEPQQSTKKTSEAPVPAVQDADPEPDYTSAINARFASWRLTPAERDVAWFTMKGMSISEIADLRGTSQGTVKAQGNAIYRKAGVGGRVQLLAAFMDELILSSDEPADHKRSQIDTERVA